MREKPPPPAGITAQAAERHALREVFALSKRRIKFTKLGMAKFISHLDLLRTFTRAVTRSGLPVRYSNGFNPHQIITFSLPLSVGVTSEAEYVDIDFEETASNEEIRKKLGAALPPDMRVLKVSMPEISANDICAAEYIIEFLDAGFSEEELKNFFNEERLPVIKKTKKGEKEVNLRDFIKMEKILEVTDSYAKMMVVLSAGGSENLKPSVFTGKLLEYMGKDPETRVYCHRTNIFYMDEKEMKIFG